MFTGTWYAKLRQLNPKLRVCQFETSKYLPGIYYVDDREGIVDVCATDKGWVPAYPQFGKDGMLLKSGYRRVIFILLHAKLITKEKVKKVFPTFFEQRTPVLTKTQAKSIHLQWSEMMAEERKRFNIIGDAKQVDVQDRIVDKMKQMEIDNFNRRNTAALSGDQFLELAADIEKEADPYKLETLDRAKFQYEKSTGKRKSII